MNPLLDALQPYPFERLRELLAGVRPPADLAPINLSIGEPRHATPPLLREAIACALDTLSAYPATRGTEVLRETIGQWLVRRYGLHDVDPHSQILPVNGSREALFAFAQAAVDPRADAIVILPSPGYQIYEGAALLAGAQPRYLPTTEAGGWRMPWGRITAAEWPRVQLVYACSPGNPTGHVMSLDEWRELFELADRHDFLIAADECYSEIYFDGADPPLGALQAAQMLGRAGFERVVCFNSLSKRSNAPGLRSGFVAGDAHAIARFLAYRTYHGSAMSPVVQAASVAAWGSEDHVLENRRRYTHKFRAVQEPISRALPAPMPDASFYLWARTPGDDTRYARDLYARQNVLVLPGSYLGRGIDDGIDDDIDDGIGSSNPGAGYVRIALVAEESETIEAAQRILAHAGLAPQTYPTDLPDRFT